MKGVGRRRKAREYALQALYQIDVAGHTADDALQNLRESFGEVEPEILGYAETLIRGVAENLEEIDGLVQGHSPNWRLERMARVDRNILRMATFELRYRPDVPTKVAINEAIEVAKRFGTGESGSFINGVLDKVARAARGGEGGP